MPQSIDDLRRSGRYGEALERALAREAALVSDRRARSWQREDAVRLVSTLRLAAALSDSVRRRLAAADRDDDTIRRLIIDGEYRKAVDLAREQLSIRRRCFGDANQEVARSGQWLAELTAYRFGGERATREQEKVLALRRAVLGPAHPEVAESLNELGYDIKNQGLSLADAENAFREGLAIRRATLAPDDPAVYRSLLALADLDRVKRDFPAAERGFREVLRGQERSLGRKHPDTILTTSLLAYVLEVEGEYREAGPMALRAAQSSLANRDVKQVDRALALSTAGYACLNQGRWAQAERFFTRTVRIHEHLRRQNEGDPLQANVQLTNYLARAVAQIRQGKEAEAWASMERGANRRVLDALLPPMQTEAADSVTDPEARDPRFASLAQVQARIPGDAALVGWLDLTWTTTPFDQSYYGYVITGSGPVHWFRGSTGDPASKIRPYTRMTAFCAEIYDAATSSLRVEDTNRADALARELYTERLAPLTRWLGGVKRLIIVQSSAALSPVPLEALVDSSGRTVGERYEVSYTPSATVFARLRGIAPRSARPADWRALLIGDPDYASADRAAGPPVQERNAGARPTNAGFRLDSTMLRGLYAGDRGALSHLPRLGGSREEVLRAASNFRSPTLLLGAQASAPALRRLAASGAIGGYDLIHFATHALPALGAYMGALALSPSAADSGGAAEPGPEPYLLDAREIATWHLGADLVTLSACQSSGLGYSTDAPIGLSKFFLMAGARTVLASLWKVDDAATSLLMTRFYEDVCGTYTGDRGEGQAQPMSEPAALGEAKNWLRNRQDPDGSRPFRHPAYWAGFILMGDALD